MSDREVLVTVCSSTLGRLLTLVRGVFLSPASSGVAATVWNVANLFTLVYIDPVI